MFEENAQWMPTGYIGPRGSTEPSRLSTPYRLESAATMRMKAMMTNPIIRDTYLCYSALVQVGRYIGLVTVSSDDRPVSVGSASVSGALDVERDSDVPISTQIYWQLAYQIDSGRLLPGSRLQPVRELGAALRVNPNTIRAVYRRLADAGYVTSRHGAGTHVSDRPPQRRGAEALAGIVAEMLRRAAHAGFTADELAAATFAAATERKRPGPLVRVLFAECTNADAGYDAERLVDAFPGTIEAEGALLDDLPERLERFHYDLVATTTFHADEAQALVAGRVPVVAMLVGPAYVELVHEIAGFLEGPGSGSCAPRNAAPTTSSRRSRCRARRESTSSLR